VLPVFAYQSTRRRAHAFARALEGRESQDQDLPALEAAAEQPGPSAGSAESERLSALARGLGELPAPELDRDVRAAQRAQVVAAMEAAFADEPPPVPEQDLEKSPHRAGPLSRLRPRSRWTKGLAVSGLTVGVAAGAFGGVAGASSDALPGDTLYGLKRGMEDLRLEMAGSDAARGQLYLDQASTRMGEARRLMERGRAGDLDHESLGEVRRALSGMRNDASEGHRLLHGVYERNGSIGAMQTLSSFSKDHRSSWTRLREQLPVQLTDVSDEVSSVFDAIDQDVGPLRSLLPGSPSSGDQGRSEKAPERTESDGADSPASAATPGPHGRDLGDRGAGPSPSASGQGQGLLDGSRLWGLPPEAGSPSPSPHTGPSGSRSATQPDITIPPLLPDLLPRLDPLDDDVQ
jgi:hypothetical protein